MNDNYDDIKHLTRPKYDDLPEMSVSDRAAQFSPFAALTGYDDEVRETARLTDNRAELTDDEINKLNDSLNRLLSTLDEQPKVVMTYFASDEKKTGGRYVEKRGKVRIYDSYTNELIFTDGTKTAIDDMISLDIML